MYGSKTGKSDKNKFLVLEIKILRTMFGPIKDRHFRRVEKKEKQKATRNIQ